MKSSPKEEQAEGRDSETLTSGFSLRQRGNWAEVAFITFTRGERTIRLFGVCHYSPAPFWERLETEVNELAHEGWAIHVEGVKGDGMGWTGRAVRYIGREGQEVVGRMLPDLLYQRDHFRHPEGAKVVDLTTEQIIDRLSPAGRAITLAMAGMLRMAAKGVEGSGGDAFSDVLWKQAGSNAKKSPLMRAIDPVLLDQRNAHAVAAALTETDEGDDVALVWGANHLPGMSTLLIKAGWTVQAVEWVPWREFPGKECQKQV